MKKLHLACAGLAALAGASAMAGCNPSAENETAHTEATQIPAGGLKIAYVEIDSLMTRYDFCKDYTILMNKKGENIRATLAGKERALQNKAAELQKKYETNQFTTKEQVEQAQMSLARQQQDLQALSDRLSNDFAAEQMKYNDALRDSLQSFLKAYNKDKKFDYIISKAGDNILLANARYDITKDVVDGLNKRYKPGPEMKAGPEGDKE